ncbi:MAG: methylmalonyl Co-A mutase-associated GTPase MeaB [Deltaproteobacteria bacterium]
MVRPSNDALEAGIVAGDRSAIGRAITLIESTRESDERLAQELLTRLLPRTGHAIRVGVTGVPGAGKSTLLDALGMKLLGRGHKVAVLAVDPSSSTSGGSILGDKTRMSRLAREVRAFIRPSPSSGELGGVAPRTRDTMLVLEAAGFDVVLVETVGVGQSETAVHGMVDTFVWLTIPNAGDELQGIKRGVLELAELVVVNKADGDRATAAERARHELSSAFHYLPRTHRDWQTPVLLTSASEGRGLDALWDEVRRHRAMLESTGDLEARRREQRRRAMWSDLEHGLVRTLRSHPSLRALLDSLERAVLDNRVPTRGAVIEARARLDIVVRQDAEPSHILR